MAQSHHVSAAAVAALLAGVLVLAFRWKMGSVSKVAATTNIAAALRSSGRQLQAVMNCPGVGEAPVVLSSTSVHLGLSSKDTLCLLVQTDNSNTLFPVARSYHGHDWERYLQLGKTGMLDFELSCSTLGDGSRNCEISNLPPPEPGMLYQLQSVQHQRSNPQDEYARFLEQTTFGTTKDELEYLMTCPTFSSKANNPATQMAKWLHVQQDPDLVPPTLHRAFLRRFANSRFETSSELGQVSHPCQKHAKFRKWAFTYKHKHEYLQIDRIGTSEYRALSINGQLITVVPGILYHFRNGIGYHPFHFFGDGKSHLICGNVGSGVGSEFNLWSERYSTCYPVLIGASERGNTPGEMTSGNPVISFVGGTPPDNIIDLDTQATALAEAAYFNKTFPNNKIQLLRAPQGLTGAACAVIMGGGRVDTIFGTKDGEYFISDPRFDLRDNSLDMPLVDGGGLLMDQTANSVQPEYQALCANAPRTFLNEETCFMTTDPQACSNRDTPSGEPAIPEAGVVVCGSPGEVANDPSQDGQTLRGAFDFRTPVHETSNLHTFKEQTETVWSTVTLTANDQLRQRVAWALSQIFVINSSGNMGNSKVEDFVTYYDILVRNAFGNYRELLREVSFSRMMSEMLTFIGSKSLGYEWASSEGILEYPDENYAREIMQLFSIGVFELNMDGTKKLDSLTGNPIQTYSNEDIMEYARAWTGFVSQPPRGNIAGFDLNRVDPLTIDPNVRDQFPKLGLNGKYIGHGHALCTDLPEKHFLKKGATYRLMGTSPDVELGIKNPTSWATDDSRDWFQVAPNGGLYNALCSAPDSASPCSFPAIVSLPHNLECTVNSKECAADSVVSVQVADGVYYEYVQPACVYPSFYNNPTKIKKRYWHTYKAAFMCADPRTAVAGGAYCIDGGASSGARIDDVYWGERIKFATAKARADGWFEKDDRYALCHSSGNLTTPWGNTQPSDQKFLWMSDSVECKVKAKVDHHTGKVAIAHSVPDEEAAGHSGHRRRVTDLDSKTFFRVLWPDQAAVMSFIETCPAPCQRNPMDDFCQCDVTVTDNAAFPDTVIPSRDEVLTQLTVGAFPPDMMCKRYTSVTISGVTVYTFDDGPNEERVFEVIDEFGVLQRRRNVISTVALDGTPFSFPNPVQFMNPAEPTVDAFYESDATIDHYFYHPNTAPFVSTVLAQRFGIANPTERFVETIANAFESGSFVYTDGTEKITFGAQRYGDMAATVAAILLDRESRSVVLDADPAHGSIREPLLKLFGMLRSLEFQTTPEFPFPRFFEDLQQSIGQKAYHAPSIFSFFSQEYQPDGAIAKAGLVSPEAELLAGPVLLGLVNGLLSTVKYGLDRCFGGLGASLNQKGVDLNCEHRQVGSYTNASGTLGFSMPSSSNPLIQDELIVETLATVLTSGRLSGESRKTIQTAISDETDNDLKLIKALELVVSSSEFHTTGALEKKPDSPPRAIMHPKTASSTPYKAVVMVNLKGGFDSYNLLVPHTCTGTNDAGDTLEAQYASERGSIGLDVIERLIIDVPEGEQQPCSQFGIHHKIPAVKHMYENDELTFFLNAGVINQPVDKFNWDANTETQLFAHNHMKQEIQAVDPYDVIVGTGILGRATHALDSQGYNSSSLSINKLSKAVYTNGMEPPVVIGERGAVRFNQKPTHETYDPLPTIHELNGLNEIVSSLHGETFSNAFLEAIHCNDMLATALDHVSISESCGSDALNMVVKLMETRDTRGVDRDVFYVEVGSWDHHAGLKEGLEFQLTSLNEAIECFVDNLKSAGLFGQTTVVVNSEFGRSLTPNSQGGSDHGWAGHTFAFGGALKGKKFHGDYPTDLTENGSLNLGRGRMIPSLSFESIWHPVLEWFGVDQQRLLNEVLPNAVNTQTPLFSAAEVFQE